MARRKTHPACALLKSSLAERLKLVRTQLLGERGGPEMARQLGLPIRTWYNYESGITVPAEVVLRFVEMTGVDPIWLLRGEGDIYKSKANGRPAPGPDPRPVRDLLREALARLGAEPVANVVPRPLPPAGFGVSPSSGVAPGSKSQTIEAEPDQLPEGWPHARGDFQCVRVDDDHMKPIVGAGAIVAYSTAAEPLESIDGQLVVARVEGDLIVRWLQVSGRYAILRSESESESTLVELPADRSNHPLRRVLWISTPH